MICVVDLEISNIQSVVRAFDRVGVPVAVVRKPDTLSDAHAVVLPGVGSFGDGMASLRDKGFVEPLRILAQAGVPLVGICLGMQLLAEWSEEHGRHEGLALVPGSVERLRPDRPDSRVPNVGWCDLHVARDDSIVPTELEGRAVYFTHSYHLRCRDEADVAATIDYSGRPVVVAIERGNLMGVQFHPEKSQDAGLAILSALGRRIEASRKTAP